MALAFEAVGGVLLALADQIPPDQRQAIENGVLLSWLAAAKAGPDQPDVIPATLGKIGWSLAAMSVKRLTMPLSQTGAAALDAAFSGSASSIASRAAAVQPDPVIAAWWSATGAGQWLAMAGAGDQPSLVLCRLTVAMPDDRVLIFAEDPQVDVTIATTSGVLNLAVFQQVASAVGEKVAPYLDKIVRN